MVLLTHISYDIVTVRRWRTDGSTSNYIINTVDIGPRQVNYQNLDFQLSNALSNAVNTASEVAKKKFFKVKLVN